MAFVSQNVQGKLAIRAVQLGDMKMLHSLIEDKEHVFKVNILGCTSVTNTSKALVQSVSCSQIHV